jgi:hypothetical protein
LWRPFLGRHGYAEMTDKHSGLPLVSTSGILSELCITITSAV